jgi:hypothetical protein
LSNAPDGDGASRRFRITHQFHPLFRREFELLIHRDNWGEDRVYFNADDGSLRSLPARWTSVAGADPAVVLGAGRAHFRVADLLELAELVRRLEP